MKLTIENAKEIVKQYLKTDESMKGDIHGSDMARGFIEGWNQAIETIEKGFLSSTKPFDLNDLEKLKVKGEK